jgi:hypothetical protein
VRVSRRMRCTGLYKAWCNGLKRCGALTDKTVFIPLPGSLRIGQVGATSAGLPLESYMRSSLPPLPRVEPSVTAHLPCADCGAAVPVRLSRALTKEKFPVLCDGCLAARVAQVKAARGEDPVPGEPSAAHDGDAWRCML